MRPIRRKISPYAAKLRRERTDAEDRFWQAVRNRQIEGFKFRFQHSLWPYVADFACMSAQLVVELDGGQHTERTEHDERRTAWLKSVGYRVLRFWNGEVFTNADGVLETIRLALLDPPPQPSPSRGEGG